MGGQQAQRRETLELAVDDVGAQRGLDDAEADALLREAVEFDGVPSSHHVTTRGDGLQAVLDLEVAGDAGQLQICLSGYEVDLDARPVLGVVIFEAVPAGEVTGAVAADVATLEVSGHRDDVATLVIADVDRYQDPVRVRWCIVVHSNVLRVGLVAGVTGDHHVGLVAVEDWERELGALIHGVDVSLEIPRVLVERVGLLGNHQREEAFGIATEQLRVELDDKLATGV